MNTSETKRSVENEKIAKELPRQSAKAAKSKTHADRWRKAIYKPKDGRGRESADYNVRIMFQGRRVNFALHTANKAAAANKAAEIYAHLVANGWEATLAKFKPVHKATKCATVGALIEAAEEIAVVNPRTLRQYASSLRQIAAEVSKIDGGTDRFAYRSERFKKWREKVDKVPLTVFTADRVGKWRAERIAVEKDPVKRQAAKVSADSTIRQAKALLGKKLLPLLAKSIELPDPLPFNGISVSKATRRFKPTVNPAWLFQVARTELRDAPDEPHPVEHDKRGRRKPTPKVKEVERKQEQWKAFCLCLLAGLRRAEADTLTWRQIDLEAGQLSIERTEYFSPKTDEAERVIDLSPEAVEVFRCFKAMPNPDPVFVLKGGEARPGSSVQYYRADVHPWRTWRELLKWLRGKGVSSQKPIHDERKLAGSLINAAFGIEAARNFLGHSDIVTTSASYLDKRPKVAVSFNLPETDFAAAGKEKTQ